MAKSARARYYQYKYKQMIALLGRKQKSEENGRSVAEIVHEKEKHMTKTHYCKS